MFSVHYLEEVLSEIKDKELKKYNSIAMSSLMDEKNYITKEIEKYNASVGDPMNIGEDVTMNYAMMQSYLDRDERLSKIYHFDRILKIEEMIINKTGFAENQLSVDEIDFVKEFDGIYSGYCSEHKILDFNDRNYPMDLFVQIVVLEDCGTVLTGEEFVNLVKGRIYFIKKADIAHLIENKAVEIL